MEIEATLRKYGAEAFMYGYENGRAALGFKTHERFVRFLIEIPAPGHEMFRLDGREKARTPQQRQAAAAQEERRRWRALALAIKAKLEVVESGIATFEEEFAAHVVLPDGTTVGEWLIPQIAKAYETGKMPELLPAMKALPSG